MTLRWVKARTKISLLSHLLCIYVTVIVVFPAFLSCRHGWSVSAVRPATACVCVAAVSVNPFVVLLHFSQFHHYHLPQNPPLWALLTLIKEKKRLKTKEKVSAWERWGEENGHTLYNKLSFNSFSQHPLKVQCVHFGGSFTVMQYNIDN